MRFQDIPRLLWNDIYLYSTVPSAPFAPHSMKYFQFWKAEDVFASHHNNYSKLPFQLPSVLSSSIGSISAISVGLSLFSGLNAHLDTDDRRPARTCTSCINLRLSTYPIHVIVDRVPTFDQEPEAREG